MVNRCALYLSVSSSVAKVHIRIMTSYVGNENEMSIDVALLLKKCIDDRTTRNTNTHRQPTPNIRVNGNAARKRTKYEGTEYSNKKTHNISASRIHISPNHVKIFVITNNNNNSNNNNNGMFISIREREFGCIETCVIVCREKAVSLHSGSQSIVSMCILGSFSQRQGDILECFNGRTRQTLLE